MVVERDESGDEEDQPLKLKMVKPRKRPAKKKEPSRSGAGGVEAKKAEPAPEAGPRRRRAGDAELGRRRVLTSRRPRSALASRAGTRGRRAMPSGARA